MSTKINVMAISIEMLNERIVDNDEIVVGVLDC